MGFESPKSPENSKIPSFTSEEWEQYCNSPIEDDRLQKWMIEKGINYDSGMIEIELDGEKREMNTSRDDFGTMFGYGEDIPSGF